MAQYQDKETLRLQLRMHGFIPPELMTQKELQFSLCPNRMAELEFEKEQMERDMTPLNESSDDLNIDKLSLQDIIMTQEDSMFSIFWKFLDTFSCIFSSYLYMYMATFSEEQIGTNPFYMAFGFEILFFLTVLKSFTTEYTPDGET